VARASPWTDGTLTLDEGPAVIGTYLAHGRAIETVDLKEQVEAMKAEIAALKEKDE
jgi:hypothetical protein